MNLNDIRIVLRLLVSYAHQRAGRTALTILSTVAAAAVVVWVVSSYDSLVAKFDDFADKYLGRYTLIVLPASADAPAGPFPGSGPSLGDKVLAALRQDPAVAAVDPVFQIRARIVNPNAPPEPAPSPFGRGNRDGQAGDAKQADPKQPDSQQSGVAERPATTGGPPAGPPGMGPPGGGRGRRSPPMLVGTDAIEPPYGMVEGSWLNPSDKKALQAVISEGAAEQLKLKVGDEVVVGSATRSSQELTLRVVGIIEQRQALPSAGVVIGLPAMRGPPLTRGPATAALYVPMGIADEVHGELPKTTYAGIVLKQGANLEEFKRAWVDKVAAEGKAELLSLTDVESELDNSTTSEHVRGQAWSATGISLLASLFIIFTTLSMGVDERVRQFAVLRAVALTRAQIALLIVLEALVLGLIGWGGGLLAGWGLLQIMLQYKPETFTVGSSLGMYCVVLSGICAIGGALAASILPAWKATRVRPLDAMAPVQHAQVARLPWIATACGLVLIAVNPLLVFYVPMADTSRYLVSAALGCTAMALGFVLLAPIMILLTEWILGPVVARLLGLNPKLLALQLSSNFLRTLGTSVALTLGLGLYVSMQVWGYSMLNPFMPGDWVPDLVVGLTPSGVPDEEFEALRHVPGVKSDQFVPLANQQVKFLEDVTGAKVRATSSRQDNCVMLGVDPQQVVGPNPMFGFRFVSGSREDALEKFQRQEARYCLVPDHFERESGLTVGDKFAVRVPGTPDKSLEYEIAGVVNMNGWHWMSKVGLRNQGGGRSAGLMFAPFDQVRKDFNIRRITYFWMNMDGSQTEEQIKASLQKIADKNFDPRASRGPGRGRGEPGAEESPTVEAPEASGVIAATGPGVMRGGPGGMRGPPGGFGGRTASIAMRTSAGVKKQMRERADGIIWMLSQLPLVTLGVTSLGVMNTVLASIRARRWEMGVLRATGVTRFSLFRMIVAESLLIGLVACLLSLCFGAMAGYCGVGVTRYVNVRGGQVTTLIIPWAQVMLGFGIALGMCLLAALWPAIRTGRTEPLTLLQQGRTAI